MTKILNLQNVVWCFLMSSFGHWTYMTIIGLHYTIHIVCLCVFLCSYTHHIVCLFFYPLKLLSLSLSLSLSLYIYIYIFLPSFPAKQIHFLKIYNSIVSKNKEIWTMDIFITNIKSTNWTIRLAACIFLVTTLKFYFIFLNNLIVTTKLVGEFLNVVLLFSYKTFDDNLN